jgi:CRP/FNR family cyclic AMP-dependent transcriptional regulator
MADRADIAPHLLFAVLDDAMRAELLAVGKKVRYRSGQTIHRRGDRDRSLQVILQGKVRFRRQDADGRHVNVAVFGPGESFGEIPLFTGRPRAYDAVAVSAVELLHISDDRFRDVLTRIPALRDCLLAELAERLMRAADKLDSALRLSVPQRVAQFLLAEANEDEGKQFVAARQADIADSLGVTREAVAAALRRFRDAGLIETRYRRIDVLNIEELRSIVGSR